MPVRLALCAAFALAPLAALAQPGLPGDPGVPVDVTVVLQGAYDASAGAMRTSLRTGGDLPAAQPYGDAAFAGTPAFYTGPEANAMPPANAVDWVVIEARRSSAAADSASAVAALLLADGSVVAASGSGLPVLPRLAVGSYFVVVRHRNHAPAMSAAAVDFTSGPGTLDLTAPGAAFGSGGTVEVASGVRALWAADATFDGLVTAPDFNVFSTASGAGASGYAAADYTLDGLVTAPDFNLFSTNAAAGASGAVPE
ncbi:MAG: hypothetical protein AAF845_17735 [Bacteroidota bacterium]